MVANSMKCIGMYSLRVVKQNIGSSTFTFTCTCMCENDYRVKYKFVEVDCTFTLKFIHWLKT